MPHGGPDWGTGGEVKTIYTIEDLGELAARLGSIVTFDRRGNVIWLDDFESGIEAWTPGSVAGGESLLWVPTYHRSDGFCAKLLTDNHTDDDAYMATVLPYPILSRIGFEYSFLRGSNLKQIYIITQLYDGTNLIVGSLRWTAATETWAYFGTDANYHDLTPTITFTAAFPVFNTLKLVCDFTANKYSRLIANNTTYDLSAIAMYVELGEGIAAYLNERIGIFTNTDDNADVHIDDAIITQNEP